MNITAFLPIQCCAAAFIENLNAESLSIRAEDFDRYMSGAATPHDPSQVISMLIIILWLQ